MKKKLFCLSLVVLAFSTQAQEFTKAIRINTLGLLVGQYQLTYEHALNEKFTGSMSAGYISRSSSIEFDGVTISKSTTSGVVLIPEVKFYFKEALNGFYAGAFFRYKGLNTKYPDLSGTAPDWSYQVKRSTIGGGIILGHHSTIGDLLSLDYYIGPHFKSVSSKKTFDNPGITEEDVPAYDVSFFDNLFAEKSGVGVRLGLNVGIAF